MTIKELLEMELHEEYEFNHGIVIRVPGGWIYVTETPKEEAYPGGMTSCFVPEPSLQAITPADGCVNTNINNGYDGCSATVEPNIMPEPDDYDKTAQADKELLTMGRFY